MNNEFDESLDMTVWFGRCTTRSICGKREVDGTGTVYLESVREALYDMAETFSAIVVSCSSYSAIPRGVLSQ